jgi:hypothetical protein
VVSARGKPSLRSGAWIASGRLSRSASWLTGLLTLLRTASSVVPPRRLSRLPDCRYWAGRACPVREFSLKPFLKNKQRTVAGSLRDILRDISTPRYPFWPLFTPFWRFLAAPQERQNINDFKGVSWAGELGFQPRLASPIKNRCLAALSCPATAVVSAHCGPSLWTIQAAAG